MKQVAAAQTSLERVNRILLQNHLETCVTMGSAKTAELIDALRYVGSLTDFRERAEPLGSPLSDLPEGDEKSGRTPHGPDEGKSAG